MAQKFKSFVSNAMPKIKLAGKAVQLAVLIGGSFYAVHRISQEGHTLIAALQEKFGEHKAEQAYAQEHTKRSTSYVNGVVLNEQRDRLLAKYTFAVKTDKGSQSFSVNYGNATSLDALLNPDDSVRFRIDTATPLEGNAIQTWTLDQINGSKVSNNYQWSLLSPRN